MDLTVSIPDQYIDRVRTAHSIQDQPATDEQLAEACLDFLSIGLNKSEQSAAIAAIPYTPVDLSSVAPTDEVIPPPIDSVVMSDTKGIIIPEPPMPGVLS